MEKEYFIEHTVWLEDEREMHCYQIFQSMLDETYFVKTKQTFNRAAKSFDQAFIRSLKVLIESGLLSSSINNRHESIMAAIDAFEAMLNAPD